MTEHPSHLDIEEPLGDAKIALELVDTILHSSATKDEMIERLLYIVPQALTRARNAQQAFSAVCFEARKRHIRQRVLNPQKYGEATVAECREYAAMIEKERAK